MTENTREPDGDAQPSQASSDANPAGTGAPTTPLALGGDRVAPTVRDEPSTDVATTGNAGSGPALRTNLSPRSSSSVPPATPSESGNGAPSGADETFDLRPAKPTQETASSPGLFTPAATAPDRVEAAHDDPIDDDFDRRPTRSYGLAAPDRETPVATAAMANEQATEPSDAAAESGSTAPLMDEPPLEEESEPFSPLSGGAVPSGQVRLLTADDTATALRLLHSRPLELGRPAAASTGDEPTPTLGAAAGGQTRESVASNETSVLPAGPTPSGDGPVGGVPPTSARRAGRAQRIAWGTAAAAATVLTAWWFISPLDSPRTERSSRQSTGAGAPGALDPASTPARERSDLPLAVEPIPPHLPSPSDGGTRHSLEVARAQPLGTAPGLASPDAPLEKREARAEANNPIAAPDVSGVPSETDKEVARAALRDAARSAGRCRVQGDPSGWTRVTITFEPSGEVSSARILKEPFRDTHTASCIEAKMKQVTIPPFGGGPMTLTHPVEVF